MELSGRGPTPACPEGQALLNRLWGTGETLTLVGAALDEVAAWAAAARAEGRRVAVAPGPEGLGVEGSARATVATLRAARAARLRVIVTTPLTRSNARVLAGLPGLLADVAAAGWQVVVPGVPVSARPAAPVGPPPPRLAVVVPYALQAIAAAERAGIAAVITGVPLCLLGPMGDRCLPAPPRAYVEACAGCPARAQCPGVDAGYLDRFGGAELSPRGVAPTGEGGRRERLHALFAEVTLTVGEGSCWPI